METAELSTLISAIERQIAAIDACRERVEARAEAIDPGNPATVESLAYQLHNLYNAAEDLFKLVASAFENHIDDAASWHRGLLWQLSLAIEGVRPALVSEEALPGLDELRRFRHLFRHSYGIDLSAARLNMVLAAARTAVTIFLRDTAAFVQRLRELRDSAE